MEARVLGSRARIAQRRAQEARARAASVSAAKRFTGCRALRHVDGNNPRPWCVSFDMAMTPAYALAHVFIPNLLKLKGHATVMSALERRDLIYFDPLWAQAHVAHNPFVHSEHRESLAGDKFRIATMSLPAPTEMGEAYMAVSYTHLTL